MALGPKIGCDGSGFSVQGLGCCILGLGFVCLGLGCWALGSGFMVGSRYLAFAAQRTVGFLGAL